MPARLRRAIDGAAVGKRFPDGTPYRSLPVDAAAALRAEFGLEGPAVELAALEAGVIPERYARNQRSFSLADQAALLRASVAVIGLGGLGGAVVELLARMGVGRLVLVDGDDFEDSNLNRQLLSTVELLGCPKAEAARRRVAAVNDSVSVEARRLFLDAENAREIVAGTDVAVDCLDNLPARFHLEAGCKAAGIPLVSAAVAGLGGHVTTVFPEDPGLRLVYGDPARVPQKGAETTLGTVGPAVTALAAVECAQVVNILRRRGALLRGRLMIADFEAMEFEVLALA